MPDIEIHSGQGSILPGVSDEILHEVARDIASEIATLRAAVAAANGGGD